MKRKILRTLPLLLITLVLAWSPALADDEEPEEFTFRIINRSNSYFVFKVLGE